MCVVCALCVSVLWHSRTSALSHLADTALPTPARSHTGSHLPTAPCVPRCTTSAFCVVHSAWCSAPHCTVCALLHCCRGQGAVGSGTPAMHCRTAWGQWAVDLLQCTASLPHYNRACVVLCCVVLCCVVLCCVVLCCVVLCCVVLCCVVLCCVVLCCVVGCEEETNNTTQHNTTRHDTTRHDTTRHDTTRHDTTQHNTTQHNTTQHNTIPRGLTKHNTTQHNTTQHNTTRINTRQHDTTRHNTSPQRPSPLPKPCLYHPTPHSQPQSKPHPIVPVLVLQTRTVLSPDGDAVVCPSADIHTPYTQPLWPPRVLTSSPADVQQIHSNW